MNDNDLKDKITAFCRHWEQTGGDRYSEPNESDWDTYGELEAHLFRFCRALLESRPDEQWSAYDEEEQRRVNSEPYDRDKFLERYYQHWPKPD